MDRRVFLTGCAGLTLFALTGDAFGESGPLTKIIFPFAAGGGGDTLCRILAQQVGQLLDRTVIVENRTGGDGLIGIKSVKNASPDGTTILVTTGPTMYLLPMTEVTPSFDTARDFAPVSLLARFEFAVVASPAIDARDFKQFVAWLKANPGKATYGVRPRTCVRFHRPRATRPGRGTANGTRSRGPRCTRRGPHSSRRSTCAGHRPSRPSAPWSCCPEPMCTSS